MPVEAHSSYEPNIRLLPTYKLQASPYFAFQNSTSHQPAEASNRGSAFHSLI